MWIWNKIRQKMKNEWPISKFVVSNDDSDEVIDNADDKLNAVANDPIQQEFTFFSPTHIMLLNEITG